MRRRIFAGAAAVLATGLTLGACGLASNGDAPTATPTSSPAAGLQSYYSQQVQWRQCLGGMECTKVQVPLDYAQADAGRIRLAVARTPLADGSKRLGSLVLNPGGPGGSGIQYAQAAQYELGADVLKSYDIVGFDPRGVGRSRPIQCMDDAQTDKFISTVGPPANAAQAEAVLTASRSVGKTCEQNSPALTPNVGTVEAARDMDIIRSVIGDEKLNYLGKSYGTFLGLTYADLFTDRVGRFVLDGVIDPTLTNDGLAKGQAEGFQLALSRFIANCPKHADCPLPTDPSAGLAKINDWLAKLATKPIKGQPGRPLTRPMALNGIVGSLYDQGSGWPALRFGLDAGFKGDGAPLEEMLDSFISRGPDGRYTDNSIDALYAVNCLDRPDRADATRTAELATQWLKTAPTFGADLAWGNYPCHDWPAPATDGPHEVKAAGASPILLVGTTNDPATPYPWAVAVSKQLENNSLITFNGDGHTGYGRGSGCVDDKVDAYLIDGRMPAANVTC